MIDPDWKTTLLASAISFTLVMGLGILYFWTVGL